MSRPLSPTDFAYAMRPVGDSGERRGHVGISCSTCLTEAWAKAQNPGWGTRLFKQRGWHVANRRSGDVCPACTAARLMPNARTHAPAPAAPEITTMNDTAQDARQAILAEPPREPTWADNRRIREALDADYDEQLERYNGGGSDVALAARLNVPRAWVTTLRASLYGPDVNEDQEREAARLATEALNQDAALTAAEAQAARLLDLAAEAEGIVTAMRAARTQLAA